MTRHIISFLFFIIAVAVFWVWTKPYLAETRKLVGEKKFFVSALADSKELQKTRDEMLNKFNMISPDNLLSLKKMIPENANETRLMVEVANIAQANGVLVEQLIVNKAESKSESRNIDFSEERTVKITDYKKIEIDMTLSSSYGAFHTFIDDLQDNLRLMDISSINFSSGDSAGIYSFNIKATTYYK